MSAADEARGVAAALTTALKSTRALLVGADAPPGQLDRAFARIDELLLREVELLTDADTAAITGGERPEPATG